MKKILIVGDPVGSHTQDALDLGWKPEEIAVWENTERFANAVKQIHDKIEVILDDDNLSLLKKLIMNRRRFTRAIGNPPYGGLDLKILNMVSELTDEIMFIMPRSIRKAHRVNAINPYLHIVEDITNDDKLFGREIRTCYQHYVIKDYKRELISRPQTHPDFEFVKKGDPSVNVFIVRSGDAGQVRTDYEKYKNMEKSHYFIHAKSQEVIDNLVSISEELRVIGRDSSGLGKVAKPEIITTYINHYG